MELWHPTTRRQSFYLVLIPLPGKSARQLPFDVDEIERRREDGHFKEIRGPRWAHRT